MIWKIAFRNIVRHKRRTLLSGITIAFGIIIFIFMDSVLTGMDRAGIDNIIELNTGAVKIQTPAYIEDQKALPLDYGVEGIEKIREVFLRDDRVTGVVPRAKFLGQISVDGETMPISGMVIDPQLDTSVFRLHQYIEGSYFDAHLGRQIILGKRLATEVGVGIGDWVTLYAITRQGAHNADDFKVVGLLNTTDPSLNQSGVLVTYEAGNEFLDLEDLATEVVIGLERRINMRDYTQDMTEIQELSKTSFPNLTAQTFMEISAGFMEISKSKRAFGMVFLFVIMLIAAVGIFNSVLMSVYERIREIGVLRALGFRPGEVTRVFLYEGLMTGLFGGSLGVVGGAIVNMYLVVYGYPIDKIAGDSGIGEFPIWGTIYGEWNITTFVVIFLVTVGLATVAGIIPARKAGTMEVTEALRFV